MHPLGGASGGSGLVVERGRSALTGYHPRWHQRPELGFKVIEGLWPGRTHKRFEGDSATGANER
jgi:hypothetical protein